MAQRYDDWIMQARRDLQAAEDSLTARHYEWSVFQAQQSAEKALKALLQFHRQAVRGHVLVHLLDEIARFTAVLPGHREWARELDRHYIQARYPNGFAAGYPGEFYDAPTAQRCIEYAHQLLQFAEAGMAE